MSQQFIRKWSLVVTKPALTGDSQASNIPASNVDLSQFHIQFHTLNQDDEGPSNVNIRVFNLGQTTVQNLLKYDFSQVTLQAGYEGQFGVIFTGNIKQFRTGRLNGTDTYLDILAADGDLLYNFGTVATNIAAGSTAQQRRQAIASSAGVTLKDYTTLGGTLPRGKVLWGNLKVMMRQQTDEADASWSIQNGGIQVLPLTGYLPGQSVVLNNLTGLIGIPEQTQEGIKARCLINPKIVVGGRVTLNSKLVNQTIQAGALPDLVPAASYANPQYLATVGKNDGDYRVYVAEHTGDSRGQEWYTDLTLLAIDATTNQVRNG